MPTEKKLIPRFSTPSRQSREVDGLLVTVCRLPARRAPAVLSRLLADVGAVVAEILSNPEKELDPEIEMAIRVMLASKDNTAKALNASVGIIKSIVFSDALSKVKGLDIGWYVAELLPKSLEVGGVAIDTTEELEETGIGPVDLMGLLWFALQVNFFPTFAGLDTNAGSEPPASTPSQPEGPTPGRITGKSSLRGGTRKAGHPGQTSSTTG